MVVVGAGREGVASVAADHEDAAAGVVGVVRDAAHGRLADVVARDADDAGDDEVVRRIAGLERLQQTAKRLETDSFDGGPGFGSEGSGFWLTEFLGTAGRNVHSNVYGSATELPALSLALMVMS